MDESQEAFLKAVEAYALWERIHSLRTAPGVRSELRGKAHEALLRLNEDVLNYTGGSRAAKAAVAQGSWNCWYTGEALDRRLVGSSDPMAPTAEHLRAKSIGGHAKAGNLLLAASWINNLVANAPITVKANVRRSLSKLAFLPSMDAAARLEIQRRTAAAVLDSYKLDGIQARPWLAAGGRRRSLATKRAKNRLALIERLGEAAWL